MPSDQPRGRQSAEHPAAERLAAEQWRLSMMSREEQRAERAAEQAARHERELVSSPSPQLRAIHAGAAAMCRESEGRHRKVAGLLLRMVERSRSRRPLPDYDDVASRLMAELASSAGWTAAFVCVTGRSGEGVAVCSDQVAQFAHDLELDVGEGPGRDPESSGSLIVEGDEIVQRWAVYGRTAVRSGIKAVAAVPLLPGRQGLGSIVAVDLAPRRPVDALERLQGFGTVLTDLMAARFPVPVPEPGTDTSPPQFNAVVHQATGMVAAHRACSCDDALALLRARAFSADVSLRSLCQRIVEGAAPMP